MENNKPIKIICDGKLEVVKITEKMFDNALEFFKNHFLDTENVMSAIEVSKSELATEEVLYLARVALQDCVSFVIRQCETKEIVAIRISRIYHPASETKDFYPEFRSPAGVFIKDLLHDLKSFDLFKEWNIDCAFELSFTTTRNDYHGLGLATTLTELSIELGRQMLNGTYADKDTLPARIRDLKPKAIYSIYTSLYTQKLGKKLGMQTLGEIPFTELFFEGKSLAEKINPIHKTATYVAMKL